MINSRWQMEVCWFTCFPPTKPYDAVAHKAKTQECCTMVRMQSSRVKFRDVFGILHTSLTSNTWTRSSTAPCLHRKDRCSACPGGVHHSDHLQPKEGIMERAKPNPSQPKKYAHPNNKTLHFLCFLLPWISWGKLVEISRLLTSLDGSMSPKTRGITSSAFPAWKIPGQRLTWFSLLGHPPKSVVDLVHGQEFSVVDGVLLSIPLGILRIIN